MSQDTHSRRQSSTLGLYCGSLTGLRDNAHRSSLLLLGDGSEGGGGGGGEGREGISFVEVVVVQLTVAEKVAAEAIMER